MLGFRATGSVPHLQSVLGMMLEGCSILLIKGDTMSRSSHVIMNGAGDNAMAEDTRDDLLTVREVARRLRVDDTTVRRWIKSGALEAITLPHRGKRQAYRIKKSTLDTLLSSSIQLP